MHKNLPIAIFSSGPFGHLMKVICLNPSFQGSHQEFVSDDGDWFEPFVEIQSREGKIQNREEKPFVDCVLHCLHSTLTTMHTSPCNLAALWILHTCTVMHLNILLAVQFAHYPLHHAYSACCAVCNAHATTSSFSLPLQSSLSRMCLHLWFLCNCLWVRCTLCKQHHPAFPLQSFDTPSVGQILNFCLFLHFGNCIALPPPKTAFLWQTSNWQIKLSLRNPSGPLPSCKTLFVVSICQNRFVCAWPVWVLLSSKPTWGREEISSQKDRCWLKDPGEEVNKYFVSISNHYLGAWIRNHYRPAGM